MYERTKWGYGFPSDMHREEFVAATQQRIDAFDAFKCGFTRDSNGNGANLDQLTQGAADIWLLMSAMN